MPYRDETYNLREEIHLEGYELTPGDRERLDSDLELLRKLVEDFPVSDLHIDIERHSRTGTFTVQTHLRLPKRSLFARADADVLHIAWEGCLRDLVESVKKLKDQLSGTPQTSKVEEGTLHEVWPAVELDAAVLDDAIRREDYRAFRRAMAVYDDALSARVGRWVERYPALAGRLGIDVRVSDLVEGVFLEAFDGFEERPARSRLGDWLERLIDPVVRRFDRDPAGEKDRLGIPPPGAERPQP